MLLPLLDAAADASSPAFLFGSSEDVLAKAAQEIADHTDGLLKIAGMLSVSSHSIRRCRSRPRHRNHQEVRSPHLHRRSRRAEAGNFRRARPRQKVWRAAPGFCSAGHPSISLPALKYVYQLFRKFGFEWIWKLATNPRRLASDTANAQSCSPISSSPNWPNGAFRSRDPARDLREH